MYNNDYSIFETPNRRLEQFLFAHEILAFRFVKNPEDGLTYWQYRVTERLERTLAEFNEVQEIRRQRRAAERSGAAKGNRYRPMGDDAA